MLYYELRLDWSIITTYEQDSMIIEQRNSTDDK